MIFKQPLLKEEKDKIVKLYRKGKTAMEIARVVKRNHTTVWNYLVRNGIHVSSQPEKKPKEKVQSEFFNEHDHENWIV